MRKSSGASRRARRASRPKPGEWSGRSCWLMARCPAGPDGAADPGARGGALVEVQFACVQHNADVARTA
jgi:hypothetical protein